MKFRKKPVEVDAEYFDPTGTHRVSLPTCVRGVPSPGADNWGYEGCRFYIDTLEGRMELRAGDWIVTGVAGEKYPVRGDIFLRTYERVL